jgi:dipeptidyl aminopeptidase/acylaminoacyl peptidase
MILRRFLSFLIFPFLLQTGITAQKRFTLDNTVAGGSEYYSYNPRQAVGGFTSSDEYFIGVREDSIFAWDSEGMKKLVATYDDIRSILPPSDKEGKKQLGGFRWISNSKVWVGSGLKFYLVDLSSRMTIDSLALSVKAANFDFVPSSAVAAFTIGNDLYLSQSGEEPTRIAHSDNPHHVFGQTVHRNEFGINKGTFWSPDARKLAFYFMDESMVEDYPLVNVTTRIATAMPIKYPMAGLESHQVKVGIFDLNSRKTIYLNTGLPADRYFTNISWTPDGKSVLIAEVNRDQNHMKLNMYDVESGNLVRTLFEESDECWIEPTNPAVFLKNSPDRFVWQSKRDGYNHLYLYDMTGRLIRQLTKGEWQVTNFYGFDPKEKNFYIQSTADGYLNRNIYRVAVKDGKMTRLSSGIGVHNAVFSSGKTMWMDYHSSLDVAARYSLVNSETGKSTILKETVNPYSEFTMPEIRMVDLKSADGNYDLTGRLILPVGFDQQKKYPVIVYVYGGPHSQMVTNEWLGGASPWMLLAAQKGYVVFCMDNRGTDGHSKAFEQAIHRQLGECEMADQMQGVKYLQALPFVDSNRIGVHGWSYGGFMTTSLMLKQSDVFKVGVCGGPVIDWSMYEVMYGERYMDRPQENAEGYSRNNLCNSVGSLKGRLLLIHGSVDPVVVWQHSLVFLNAAIANRVQVDYFVYPNHEHNVIGRDRVHLIDKVLRYFDDFL